jgi:hypothetical protein
MAVSHWRIFTDTRKPEAAQRLTEKLQSRAGRDLREIAIDEYHKGGHVVTFNMVHECEQWNTTVHDVIVCAQEMGHGWSIGGFAEEELDLTSTGSSIPGIKLLTCFCRRSETSNEEH